MCYIHPRIAPSQEYISIFIYNQARGMREGKKSMGRRRIQIKRIARVSARQVCFSKRRQGLFKKASELSILCGTMVGIVAFSPAGRPYSLGYPSIHAVIDEFLTLGNHSSPTMDHRIPNVSGVQNALVLEYNELKELVRTENLRTKKLKEEIEQKDCKHYTPDISGLGPVELHEIYNNLKALDGDIKGKIFEVAFGLPNIDPFVG